MKRILMLTLVAVFMVSMLFMGTSCKAEEEPVAEEPVAEEPVAEEPVAEEEEVGKKKIVFWNVESAGEIPKIIERSIERFMADNPDVEVEVVSLQNDPYKEKIKIALGAGNPPDIFPHWSGGVMVEYIKSDHLVDLTEMMNKDNYTDFFLDAAISQATYDGKIWAVPVENVSCAVVFYNKQIFDDLNLSVPKTYTELIEIVEALKSEGIAPFSLANKTKWPGSMYYMYIADRLAGPELFSKAANREGGSFEDPAYIEAGRLLQELVNMDAFVEGFNALDYDTGQSRTLLYSGDAAMEIMGTWNLAIIGNENPEFLENNLDFFPFPAIEGGKGDPGNVVGSIGQMFYSVSSTSEYPEEAFEMIEYLLDEQAVEERLADGRIPPIKGLEMDDPNLQKVMEILEAAPSVQLWYDQYLPPELGEVHKDTSQALFGLVMTPEEAAEAMEAAAKRYYGE